MRKSILYTALTAMIATAPGAAFADCVDLGSEILVDGKVMDVDYRDNSNAGNEHRVRVRTATLSSFYWFADTADDNTPLLARAAQGTQTRIFMRTDATTCPGSGGARNIGNILAICTTSQSAC